LRRDSRSDHGRNPRGAFPPTLLENVPLDLSAFPVDLDHRTETVLRKAYVLANDWKIDSPDLIRQLM
jgi:hypothetical protein